MTRQHGVLLFFALILTLGLVSACGTGGGPGSSSGSSGGTDCGGCNCAGGCGQIRRCSTGPATGPGSCHTSICCCTGAPNCTACGCT
jgi:hypothetical protein